MKTLVVFSSIFLLMSSNGVLAAIPCGGEETPLEKEMLELTYMELDDLKRDFCSAKGLIDRKYTPSQRMKEISDFNAPQDIIAEENACNRYAIKVSRILKKDHGIKKVECVEGKPK